MHLIVDANILFSFFNKSSDRRYLFEELSEKSFLLIAPDFSIDELVKDKEKIKKYSFIDDFEFSFLLSLLKDSLKIVPKSEYERYISSAAKVAPHTKDVPYFALALKFDCRIWSDEKSFKKQSKVKMFSTKELLKIILS